MTVSRPARLAVGGEVGLRGSSYTITALAGGAVALAGVTGEVLAVPVAGLLSDASFAVLTPRPRAPLPARGVLDGLPAEVAGRAQWWERHVTEVLTGVPAGSPPGTVARGEYDPLRVSPRQRELSKVAELRAAGEPVSLATLGRMRCRYQSGGLLGLVDGRLRRGAGGAVDERVITAIEKEVAGETDRSTGTVTRLRWRVAQSLAAEYDIDPAQIMPPRTTFYRLVAQIAAGRHTFGSAPTRRSLARARAKAGTSRTIPASAELMRLYADYLAREYGSLDSDYAFVNLWSQPYGPMDLCGGLRPTPPKVPVPRDRADIAS